MDRDQQRQNRRNTVSGFSCTAGAELNPLQNPAGRTGAACDPIPAAPVPFTAVSPTPCPAPLPVALNLPDGLIVPSDATIAYCPSTAGYSVTGTTASAVATGAQNQTILFTAISNITENQLNYLYQVVPSTSAAMIAAALSGSTSSVIDLTHLNYNQAEELIESIQDAKFVVNTLAVEQARNLLICQAENNLQTASCPTSAYFGPSAGVPTGMMYVPSATSATGAVLVTFSLLSTTGDQAAFAALNIPSLTAAAAQANLLALAQAESSLRCVYGNTATDAACCTSQAPNNNLGYTAACVPATGPTIPGSATAVGFFSVPENTVFSVVSKNEANSVAREISRNSLNCYFPSEGITATCVGQGLSGPFAPESTTSTYLPPGAVILYGTADSVTAANIQASDIAVASLNCFWSNIARTAFCPASPGFTAINNQYYTLPASSTASPHYSSTVPANTVISYISLEDANAQALDLASANLSCVYCNTIIPPTCSGGINETIGATGGLICNVLAEVAQNTAISLGNILVTTSEGGLNCCYGNEGVTNTFKCGSGAYFASNTAFTSADVFYIPPNVITICAAEPAPPTPQLLFPYPSLYATDVAAVGCCFDTVLCPGVTGSYMTLPPLWAAATDLFSVITSGATFYTDAQGTIPYAFPATASYVVSHAGARTYRAITGGTGYTVNLTSCAPCLSSNQYNLRGGYLHEYANDGAAYIDIFCGGPTSDNLTLYTSSNNPFLASTAAPAATWYTDPCGLTAFSPVTAAGATNNYYLGYVSGSTGYMLVFSQIGSNTAALDGTYSTTACPVSKYPYTVYISATACSFSGATTTLYGSLPSPQLFTSSSSTANFYTAQFNDSSIYSYPSGTGYINFSHNTTDYYRRINGVSASPPQVCSPLYPVTVQWMSLGYTGYPPSDICNYPNYYKSGTVGVFNTNIRTLWCTVEDPFTDSATAIFYSKNLSIEENIFQPGNFATYLSKFTPGDTYRNSYREYTTSDPVSVLKSYTGTFKRTPFPVAEKIWAHSATANYLNNYLPTVPNTKFLLNGITGTCERNPLYSDLPITIPTYQNFYPSFLNSYKKLLLSPISGDVYSPSNYNYLLFDGVGFELSASASGVSTQTNVTLNDMSKIGAGFTGAIVRCANVNRIGNYQVPGENTAIPAYISSIDYNSGVITLGGYYNQVHTTFSNEALYVTGFKIEAGNWTGSQFTCYGPHCNKLEVGHSLVSYYVSPTGQMRPSIGYVNKVDGVTIYYSGAPGYNNFSSYDIGTGASHGSGHVYIQGRQFARFWNDVQGTSPYNYDLGLNSDNFLWSQTGSGAESTVQYTVAKNLVLGNTPGSTSEFIVAGLGYSVYTTNVPPRPYSYTGGIYFNTDLDQYQYNSSNYSCDGAYDFQTVPVSYTQFGNINLCCDLVSPSGGGTAVSACDYFDTYQVDGVAPPIDPSNYVAFTDLLSGYNLWYNSANRSPLSANRIMNGLSIDGGAQTWANGVFGRCAFLEGQLVGTYPCNSKNDKIYPLDGTSWMREYMGYYDPADPYFVPPQDCTVPGTGCVALDNSVYWNYSPEGTISPGYIFKEYVPATAAVTGCNSYNFIPLELGLTSGYRYTIWSTTGAAWADVNQINQIAINCTDPGCANSPLMAFDPSTAGCEDLAPAGFNATAEPLVNSDVNTVIGHTVSDVIEFNPSEYDLPTFLDFGNMPSVGGTAESLKAEATQVAQNIVNSFVRCFYFNDYTTGATCADPTYYLIQQGFAAAGEVVSNISKANANTIAKTIADSRTVCLNPDFIGGAGCASTQILNASATSNLGGVYVSFQKNDCTFTTSMSFSSNVEFFAAKIRKITICSVTGGQETIYVLDNYGIPGVAAEPTVYIPLAESDPDN